MKFDQYLAACEAVVFASGDPIRLDRVSEALELSREDTEKLLLAVQERYDRRDSGIELVRLDDCWQFCTRSACAAYVKRAFEIKRNAPLSQAALEVLAVIAYNQPVTRAFVEQVRGVDCAGVVGTLCEKGLIEERGRLELPGRPLLYGTTPVFLRSFGLSSLEELPPLPEDMSKGAPASMLEPPGESAAPEPPSPADQADKNRVEETAAAAGEPAEPHDAAEGGNPSDRPAAGAQEAGEAAEAGPVGPQESADR